MFDFWLFWPAKIQIMCLAVLMVLERNVNISHCSLCIFFSKSFMAKQQKREYASFLDKPIMQN